MTERVLYHESARSYRSSVLLALILGAGFGWDQASGGARVHAAAWIASLVVVVGADAFTVHYARKHRSLTLTDAQLRLGEVALGMR